MIRALSIVMVLSLTAFAQSGQLVPPGGGCSSSQAICNLIRLRTGDGTAALPAWAFRNDIDTGFYRVGANQIGVSTNGTRSLVLNATAGTIEGDTATPKLNLSTANGISLGYGANSALICDSQTCSTFGVSGTYVFRSVYGFGTGATPGNGTAFASLPACVAGKNGHLMYDSTGNAWRECRNGSGWLPVGPRILADDVTTYVPSATALLNVSAARATWPRSLFGAQGSTSFWGAVSVQLHYATTLVAGVGAGDAVYTIYNVTDAVATGADVTVPCASAAGTVSTGNSDPVVGLVAAGKDFELRLTTNGCGTLPAVNITWGYAALPAGT